MAKSIPHALNPTGYDDVAPPNPDVIPRECHKKSLVLTENHDVFLDWRAQPPDDDPALIDVWGLLSRDFATTRHRGRRTALDPEDAVQETWLAFLSHLGADRMGDEEGPKAWLTNFVGNRLANLRRQSAWRLQELLDEEATDALVGREDDPAVAYERGQVRSLVRAVLEEARSRLPELSYRIIVLRWIEERTYLEISESLEIAIDRVRDRQRRALSLLRILIVRRFGSDPPPELSRSRG